MRLVKRVFSSILILIAAVGGLAFMSNNGHPPGLSDEQLAPCPNKPNCVRSEDNSAQNHFIEPIEISPEQQHGVMLAIKTSIVALGGQIQSEQTNYLASTFSSKIFGFIDDLEIRIDPKQNRIHLRSASRVGYSDLGVNRKRTEALKTTIQSHLDTMTGTLRDQ